MHSGHGTLDECSAASTRTGGPRRSHSAEGKADPRRFETWGKAMRASRGAARVDEGPAAWTQRARRGARRARARGPHLAACHRRRRSASRSLNRETSRTPAEIGAAERRASRDRYQSHRPNARSGAARHLARQVAHRPMLLRCPRCKYRMRGIAGQVIFRRDRPSSRWRARERDGSAAGSSGSTGAPIGRSCVGIDAGSPSGGAPRRAHRFRTEAMSEPRACNDKAQRQASAGAKSWGGIPRRGSAPPFLARAGEKLPQRELVLVSETCQLS